MVDTHAIPKGATETSIDNVNIWMRSTPWYQEKMREWGQDPGHPTLTKSQSQQLMNMARQQGVQVDDSVELDNHGNFNPKGHKLRNTLLVAGIAGATLATMGAAGMFAGAAGPAAASAAAPTAAGAAGGAGGVLGSTAIGSGFIPAIPALSSGASAAAGAAGGSGVLGTVGSLASKGGSTLGKIGDILGAAGTGVSNATTAAGNNALDQEKLGLEANAQNITGNTAFETAMLNRAKQEGTERTGALKDVYRKSYSENPSVGPFNPKGAPTFSQQYKDTLSGLADQGAGKLKESPTYSTDKMAPVTPYIPIKPDDVQGATGTEPGTLQKIGNYLGPALNVAGQVAGQGNSKKLSLADIAALLGR